MSPFLYKWLKYSLLALVVGGFVALAVYALIMRDEIRNAQIEPPLIAAPTQDLKSRPNEPTGLQFPNQDKLVFDLLENSAPAGSIGTSGNLGTESGTDGGTATAPNQLSLAAAASSFASPTPVPAAVSPVAAVAPEKLAEIPTEAVAAPTPVAPVAEAPKPTPVAKVAEKPAPTPVGGSWGVQLAAVGSAADGQTAAKQLQAKFSALSGLKIRVVPAPNSARHRVQFVGLPTRTAAQAVCDKLGSQPCFPIGK